jgi:protein-tyrosine phosphatase
VQALDQHGLDGTQHRARQFDPDWFDTLDLVIVFDRSQERILRAWANNDVDRSKVQLLMSFDGEAGGLLEVPDPYYSDAALFDQVLGMIERAGTALYRQVSPGIPKATANL